VLVPVLIRSRELMVHFKRCRKGRQRDKDERHDQGDCRRNDRTSEGRGSRSDHGRRACNRNLNLCQPRNVLALASQAELHHATLCGQEVGPLEEMPVLIDTHTHLDDARFDGDRDAVIARAREAGVETFITIGCDLATSRAAVSLADRYPFIYATVGVHPHEVKCIGDDWYDELRRLAQHPKVVAYGEIGLDYHYNHSPPKLQRDRFREQVCLARELHLPLVIHTREAQEDTIKILREEKGSEVGGVFHCFSGDAWLAKDALDLGFSLSFSGVVTFQNATMLRDIMKTVPMDRLLVETDCPYLTPAPHRGKRNEPAYVRFVAEKISELKGSTEPMSVEEIGRITSQNARRAFKIP